MKRIPLPKLEFPILNRLCMCGGRIYAIIINCSRIFRFAKRIWYRIVDPKKIVTPQKSIKFWIANDLLKIILCPIQKSFLCNTFSFQLSLEFDSIPFKAELHYSINLKANISSTFFHPLAVAWEKPFHTNPNELWYSFMFMKLICCKPERKRKYIREIFRFIANLMRNMIYHLYVGRRLCIYKMALVFSDANLYDILKILLNINF